MTSMSRVLNEKRRLILPLVIVLLANIGFFGLVNYPLSQKVAVGEQEAHAALAALGAARREHANARATVAGKGQADAELAKFYTDVLPPDLSGARRITFLPLQQLASSMNLKVEHSDREPAVIRDSQLRKLSQTAILTGEYRDIRRFIHQLETSPEFIVIENVQLTQGEGNRARGITVTLQVATYYRSGGDGN